MSLNKKVRLLNYCYGKLCSRIALCKTRTVPNKRDFSNTPFKWNYEVPNHERKPIELNEQNVSAEFLDRYDTILLDCDGTLWNVDHVTPIAGISSAIQKLQGLGKKLLYVTNNSLHGNDMYAEKFKTFGFEAPEDDIFGVAHATAVYLRDIVNIDGKVYMSGSKGMKKELDQVGIDNFGFGPDLDTPSWDPDDLLKFHFEDNVKAVLIGFDEHFCYNKLYKAASYLTNENCEYIATNDVETGFLLSENRMQPVTGSVVSAVTAASKRTPHVIGKPHHLLYDCILKKHPNVDKSRTVIVGDSIRADVGFANRVGIDSVLVLTGAGTLAGVKANPQFTPTFIMNSLALVNAV